MTNPTRVFFGTVVFLAASGVSAQTSSIIAESAAAVPPAYDSIKGLSQTVAQGDYLQAVESSRGMTLKRVVYRSDGQLVSAYVAAPDRGNRLPVVVFNRGGYVVKDQLAFLLPVFVDLCKAGFVVVAPMLRGSDGMAGKDEMGGDDLRDLEAAINHITEFGPVDPDRLFLAGESRGGVMTYLAIKEKVKVRAAAVWGAITDMEEYLAHVDPQGKIAHAVWPDYDQRKKEILVSRSAKYWPGEIRVPLLIMHGSNDQRVSPLNALHLAEQLQTNGQEYQLVIFANDNHTLDRNWKERNHLMIEWFRLHLN